AVTAAHVHVAVNLASRHAQLAPATNLNIFAQAGHQTLSHILHAAFAIWIGQRHQVSSLIGARRDSNHLVDERQVILVTSGKVGLDIYLDDHAAQTIGGNARSHYTFGSNRAGPF